MRFTSVFFALLCASSGADASERSKDRHSSLRNEKNHQAKDSAVGRCIDNNNFLDKFGNDCYFYDKYPNMCENSCAMNRRGETPETECCACQDFGCTDVSNFKDKDGMTCSQYDNNKSWCKDADSYANRNGVSANDACCACGGGRSGEDSDLPFAGKLYDIRGFGLNADKYLQISARNGVHMVSSGASRKQIEIEEINGKYALKEDCVYASCQVAYLTIENPNGEAYVTTTSRISADIEFDIMDASTAFNGEQVIKHVLSGRYLSISDMKLVTKNTHGMLNEYFVLNQYGGVSEESTATDSTLTE